MATLNETVDKAKAMLTQTQAEGSKPFADSTYTIPSTVLDNPPVSSEIPAPVLEPIATPYSASDVLDNEIKRVQSEEASLQKQADPYLQNIRSAYSKFSDPEGQYNQLLEEQGYGDTQKAYTRGVQRLNTLQGRMRNFETAFDKSLSDLELDGAARDITKGTYNAQSARVSREASFQRRAMASEIESQAATVEALRGNMDAAADHAKFALSLRFQANEKALEAEKLFLSRVDAQLEGKQKEQAELRRMQIDEQLQVFSDAKNAVQMAVQSGGVQSGEIEKLMAMNPKDQIAYANVILGRTAASDRNLDRALKATQLEKMRDDLRSGKLSTTVIELPNGNKALINTQTGETIREYGQTSAPADTLREYESQRLEIDADIARVEDLLGNKLGLVSSSGAYQPDKVGGFFTGSFKIDPERSGAIANMLKFVPGIGNAIGAAQTATQKGDFLTGVSYIVNNQTFDKLMELKQGGATFGALSDPERVAIGRAASDLAASTITNEAGDIVGFKGSTDKLIENINLVLDGYKAAKDELNITYGIPLEDANEAMEIWNSN